MEDEKLEKSEAEQLLSMTSDIVSAYVSFNSLPAVELGGMIQSVHETLLRLQKSGQFGQETTQKPAVPIRKSVTDDYIICLENGVKLKMLKRYLRTNFNMTPDEYREKWGLPVDYPMVAPNYAAQRSQFAKKIGLGKNRNTPEASDSHE